MLSSEGGFFFFLWIVPFYSVQFNKTLLMPNVGPEGNWNLKRKRKQKITGLNTFGQYF